MSPAARSLGSAALFVASLAGVTGMAVSCRSTPIGTVVGDDNGGDRFGEGRGEQGAPPDGDNGAPRGEGRRGDRGGRGAANAWSGASAVDFGETLIPQVLIVGGFAGFSGWSRRRKNKARRASLGV